MPHKCTSLGQGEQGATSPANVKLDQIRTILCAQYAFDIITISETWLTNNVSDDDINLDGYTLHRRDRETRGGGVRAYVHCSLPCKRRSDLENRDMEIMWLEIRCPRPMLIAVVYRAPGMSRTSAINYINNFHDCVKTALDTCPHSLYILGDFNDRCTEWESTHTDSELKQDLLNCTTSLGLYQQINEATYTTPTTPPTY